MNRAFIEAYLPDGQFEEGQLTTDELIAALGEETVARFVMAARWPPQIVRDRLIEMVGCLVAA